MKVHIHELMDNIEDSSVNIEEQNVVSSERIKELTKMKIQNAGNTKKRSKKGLVTIGIAVAVVAALGTTAFAVFNGGLGGLSFGKRSLAEEIEADTGVSIPNRSSFPYRDIPTHPNIRQLRSGWHLNQVTTVTVR